MSRLPSSERSAAQSILTAAHSISNRQASSCRGVTCGLAAWLVLAFVSLAPAAALASNPVPFVDQPLIPEVAAPGGSAFTLTVKGTGFVPGAKVDWKGSPRTTTFVTSTTLTATINASDIAAVGTASVTVINPGPGGGASNVVFFIIANATTSPFFAGAAGSPITVGTTPQSVAVGDFNGDGRQDLAVANASSNNVTILLGNGDGTFTAASKSPATGNNPQFIAVGDFNGDGKMDLVVVNSNDESVTILLGNGDGTFTALAPISTFGPDPVALAVGDFNGDGKLDLAVANSGYNSVAILFGNGDGTFTFGFQLPIGAEGGSDPIFLVAGDFNGDGIIDLAVANAQSNNVMVFLGNGGGFNLASSVTVLAPRALAAADFNGDGKLDLAVAESTGAVDILLGNGDGIFYLKGDAVSGLSNPQSVAVADLNGDGKLDLAVAAGNGVIILLGNGDGTFTASAQMLAAGNLPTSLAIGDFNGDGGLDLATANSGSNSVSVFLQVPVAEVLVNGIPSIEMFFASYVIGTTSPPQTATLLNTGGVPLSVAGIAITGADAGDFAQTNNCDGSVIAGGGCTINVTFTPTQTGPRNASLTITDNSNGVIGSTQTVFLSGIGTFAEAFVSPTFLNFHNQTVGSTSDPQPVTLTNGGTAPLSISSIAASGDFAQTNNCGSSVPVSGSCTINVTFTPAQSGAFNGALTVTDDSNGIPGSQQSVSMTGFGVIPAPFINQPLIPTAATPGGSAFTLTVNGSQFVSGAVVHWTGSPRSTRFVSNHQLTATIDAPDIALPGAFPVTVVNPGPGGGTSNAVLFIVTNPTASALFTNAVGSPISVGAGPVSVAEGDFNGDGVPDLAVVNSNSNNVTILLGNGDGTFTAASQSPPTGNSPHGMAVGDFNGDGRLDLAVANNGSNNVTIVLGNGDGTFTAAALPATGSHPVAVAVGDLNGDGRLDLAVANTFDNSITILLGNGDGTFTSAAQSPATGSFPLSLSMGDLNGDGKLDLAVANRFSNNITILLGNGDGTFAAAASPATGMQPVSVAIGDLNGDGKLDLAVANNASNTVTVLLGNGDGTFTAAPSPATGGSPFPVVVGDFNGDGKQDLAITNSSDNTITILLGNGDGTFTAAVQLPATGDLPAALAVGDFNGDGRLDLAVVNAGDNTLSVLLQPAVAGLSPDSLTFSNQQLASTSPPQAVTLSNTGTAPLAIAGIAISGANSGDFAQTNNCDGSVIAGGSCTINITFTPTQDGTRNGTLTVTDNSNGAIGSLQTVSLAGTGISIPVASVSPPNLTFGSQGIGTTSGPHPVTLTNTGTAALSVSSITASGDFAQSNNCGGSVAAGGSCTINVTFTPTAIGTRNGTLTVTDNSNGVSGSQQAVSLTGTGINPGGSVSPTSLAFGNQADGTTSASKKVTLTSTGTTNLMFSGITFTGANAGDFGQTNNCPATMALGAKCTINVTFTPSMVGSESAMLGVNDNAANSPQTVALSGTGVSPVTLSPPTLSFGNQADGTTSAAKTVTLTNNLSASLAISSVATSGDFAQTNTCGASVPSKGKCTINVTFTPSVVGAETGTLTVTDAGSNSPQTASLTGTGIAQATVSPTSLTFAAQKVGTTSAAKNVTLTNNLATALTMGAITFSGDNAGDYVSPTNTCGASLAAKAHCTISVIFKPTATGTRTATLNLNDSANNSPQTVSLTGTGK